MRYPMQTNGDDISKNLSQSSISASVPIGVAE